MFTEINVDGIVGPTHHFGGLGVGNVASIEHQHAISHPRQAALEGLRKAELIASLGIPQFIFVPPVRPRLSLLSDLGFHGTLQEQLNAARAESPRALSAAFSGAFMWMANAATVTPTADSWDGRLHCTPANLISSWHRGSEAAERAPQLHSLLHGLGIGVALHPALPYITPLRDEGAANHMRLCDRTGHVGFNVFVYGADDAAPSGSTQTYQFFPRQSRAASMAIARRHHLASERTFFLHQHPRAIDAGVFHNDVIATSCDRILLHHEFAFLDAASELDRLENQFHQCTGESLLRIVASEDELPLVDAVRSYFFNSQLVRCGDSRAPLHSVPTHYELVCPHHCAEVPSAQRLIERLIADPSIPIQRAHFLPLNESMSGGGGPACLRLRMMIHADQVELLNSKWRLTHALSEQLSRVIEQWYPEQLSMVEMSSADFVDYLTRVDEALAGIFE